MITEKDLITKARVLECKKIQGKKVYKLETEDGPLFVGDYIFFDDIETLKKNVTLVPALYDTDFNITTIAAPQEKVHVPIPHNIQEGTTVVVIRNYVPDLITLGLISRKKNHLNESAIEELFHQQVKLDITKTLLLKEDIFSDILRHGLKVVIAPLKYGIKHPVKVSVGLALGFLAKKLWQKFTDPCKRPFQRKEDKIRCYQQAAERVANEIRREQQACNEFQDPSQRRKCFYKVEKLRREYLQKSAELKAELYGK